MLDNLVLFVSLYEFQSFKKCAETLDISAPTLSRRISDLESKLGKKLIIRDTKNFEPTEFGIYIYNQTKNIPLFIENMLNVYKKIDNQQNINGVLTIALGDSIAYELINPHINEFLNQYPGIKLNISYIPNITAWPSKNIDVVLSVGHINDINLNNRFLRKEYVKFYCNTNYVAKYGVPAHVDELKNHSIFGPINDNYLALNYIKLKNINTHEEYLLDLTANRLNINSSIHSRKIGLNADFIFGCIESLIQKDLKQNLIVPVLPNWAMLDLEFYLITKKNTSEHAKVFINFIFKCMNQI